MTDTWTLTTPYQITLYMEIIRCERLLKVHCHDAEKSLDIFHTQMTMIDELMNELQPIAAQEQGG